MLKHLKMSYDRVNCLKVYPLSDVYLRMDKFAFILFDCVDKIQYKIPN